MRLLSLFFSFSFSLSLFLLLLTLKPLVEVHAYYL